MTSNYINIFGFNILNYSYDDLLKIVEETIIKQQKVCISYVNFYVLQRILKSRELSNCVEKIRILHSDGIGIYWASKFLYGKKGFKEKVNGTDLYFKILELANSNKWKVFFYGGGQQNSIEVEDNLRKKYKNLLLSGVLSRNDIINKDELVRINQSNSQILYVGLGSPEQEKFLSEYSSQINIPVQIAIGSGIDYISGNYKRAPLVLRKIELEWFYRLLKEPKRLWKRYLIGIPVFVFKILCFKVRLIMNKS